MVRKLGCKSNKPFGFGALLDGKFITVGVIPLDPGGEILVVILLGTNDECLVIIPVGLNVENPELLDKNILRSNIRALPK